VQVLETREELELVTEKLDFVRDAATIRVGNVAAKTRIVQVHRKGIRVLDHAAKSVQDMACGDLVTSLRQDPAWAADPNDPNEPKGSADDRIEIREAAISDPFVLLVLTDDTQCLLSAENSGEKVLTFSNGNLRKGVSCLSVIRSDRAQAYFGAERGAHLVLLCDVSGNFEVRSLPGFQVVFHSLNIGQGYAKVFHATAPSAAQPKGEKGKGECL